MRDDRGGAARLRHGLSQIRVLYVIDNLGVGGAERVLVNLTTALNRQGQRSFVAALRPPYTLAAELEEQSVPVYRVGLSHRWNLAQALPRVRRLIVTTGADVVHGHLFFGGVVTAFSRPSSVCRVVTFHNLAYESFPPVTTWLRLRRQIEAIAMRRGVDRHIAVSRAVADHYTRHLGVRHIDVIPNGVALPARVDVRLERATALRHRLGLPVAEKLVLCPGSFKPQKAQEVLVEAIRIAASAGTVLHLAFAGDGARRPAIEQHVRQAGLRQTTSFLGQLDHERVLDAMAACDLVAISSRAEGFPLATVEAMAMGRAVVATDVGGQPEIITDERTGLLVPSGNAQALADGIVRLLGDDALRARLGAAGKARVEALCDIDNIAARHLAIYGAGTRSHSSMLDRGPGAVP